MTPSSCILKAYSTKEAWWVRYCREAVSVYASDAQWEQRGSKTVHWSLYQAEGGFIGD